MICVRII